MRRAWGLAAWPLVVGTVAAAPACGGGADGGTGSGWQASDAAASTTVFMERLSLSVVNKIDLLFMVDNSISMADKQQLLADAVPQLLGRLIDPICVDDDGPCGDSSSLDGCDCGAAQFAAVEDLHLGIVTSSLGGFGGTLCSPTWTYWNAAQNDLGHLIDRSLAGGSVDTWNGQGFLSWDPEQSARNPNVSIPGTAESVALVTTFRDLVQGAGEQGCGFEASLEAWYRLLIDPEPPLDVVVDPATQMAAPVGVDEELLAQRAQFLRPDSLVAIVMLSDENDCSMQDWGYGHFVAAASEGSLPRATSICETNPNDPCCLSCVQAAFPAGCSSPQADPACAAGVMLEVANDRLNLRCFDHKRRFGLDFLQPIARYVDGLRNLQVPRRDGSLAPNPLYSVSDHPLAQPYRDLAPRMDHSLVFLAGIVGVPWQDIATDETLYSSELEYLTATEIAQRGIWLDILGEPEASPPLPPNDPFMIESIAPRSGVNPRTGIAIEPPVDGAGGNDINGHEFVVLNDADLQYACIFPLAAERDCGNGESYPPGVGCDCRLSTELLQRPLCDGTIQRYARAFPGTRQLQVLRDYGANSIVASICPRNANSASPTAPSYGYNPAMAAIVERLREGLRGSCLPRALDADEHGQIPCQVVEVTSGTDPAPCAGSPGRAEPAAGLRDAVLGRMRDVGLCHPETRPCDAFSLCQLLPAEGTALTDCREALDRELTGYGYCYIDAASDTNGDGVVECRQPGDTDCLGNPELVTSCPDHERRRLRFSAPPEASVPLPWPSATVFIGCQQPLFGQD